MDEALEKRIATLELAVQQLGDAVDELRQARNQEKRSPPPQTPPGTLARGKYSGKPHAVVLQADPDYVCWNADKGYAAGLGFTDEQIAEARALLADNPELAQKQQKSRHAPW